MHKIAPQSFIINKPSYKNGHSIVHFHYSFDNDLKFCEEIDFQHQIRFEDEEQETAFNNALHHLAIALGISYYKAYIPNDITLKGFEIDADCLNFFHDMYFHGLGEFAYRNKVSLKNKINFTAQPADKKEIISTKLPQKNAILIGGGKDSVVSVEILKQTKMNNVLFAVNPAKPILDCAEKSGLDLIQIKRRIDPKLFELNEQGVYNGHVPITGMISLIAACASYLYGFNHIILSNERSASQGNTEYEGEIVNHQFSKSFGFEAMIANHMKQQINPALRYFSLLRPLSELAITRLFTKTDIYDDVFTSCNTAFKIMNRPDQRWCRDCPKCRFVFLALSTAMPLSRLTHIFGGNMFEDETQINGFKALCGIGDHKPWECVGEIEESASAFKHLSSLSDYNNLPVVKALSAVLPKDTPDIESFMNIANEHNIPDNYMEALHAYMG